MNENGAKWKCKWNSIYLKMNETTAYMSNVSEASDI